MNFTKLDNDCMDSVILHDNFYSLLNIKVYK